MEKLNDVASWRTIAIAAQMNTKINFNFLIKKLLPVAHSLRTDFFIEKIIIILDFPILTSI